jgi:hypothetical protein
VSLVCKSDIEERKRIISTLFAATAIKQDIVIIHKTVLDMTEEIIP